MNVIHPYRLDQECMEPMRKWFQRKPHKKFYAFKGYYDNDCIGPEFLHIPLTDEQVSELMTGLQELGVSEKNISDFHLLKGRSSILDAHIFNPISEMDFVPVIADFTTPLYECEILIRYDGKDMQGGEVPEVVPAYITEDEYVLLMACDMTYPYTTINEVVAVHPMLAKKIVDQIYVQSYDSRAYIAYMQSTRMEVKEYFDSIGGRKMKRCQ